MKILFISDIHGLTNNIYKINSIFIKEKCDLLVVLGDILYTPIKYRNSEFYNEKLVEIILKQYKDKLICIKGNCDIILMKDIKYYNYYKLKIDDLEMNLSHMNCITNDSKNKIFIYGHEHIPYIRKKDNNICICVGSISTPRYNSKCSYMIYENKIFTIYDFDNNIIDKINMEELWRK